MAKPDVSFRPVAELAPYARNARTHSAAQIEQLADSIREFGWTLPVLADRDGIVAGHARVQAAKLLYDAGEAIRLPSGGEIPAGTVPVIDCTGWTTAQRRAYILADNRLAENASWDTELLAGELSALMDIGFDVDLLGFDEDELKAMRPDIGAQAEEDDVPPAPAKPVCQPGDLWQLGSHRLLCGDALDRAAMRMLLDGTRADLVVTDPPYNVGYEGKTAERLHIENDAMSGDAFRRFLLAAYQNLAACARPGAGVYVFHADAEGIAFRAAFAAAGLKLAQCCVWVKQSFVLGRNDYHWQHEPVLYGWKPGAAHCWHGDRAQSTVWAFDRPSRSEEHPTMKPVALLEYLIGNSSRVGDVVLDPFGGSGSTLIACEQTGRRAYLMEIDPRYCDVILRRWTAVTGDNARLADGRSFEDVAVARAAGVAEPKMDAAAVQRRSVSDALRAWVSRHVRGR
ncbi:DNA modification methylase [Cupriavidus sp. OV038]|jgi:DNA modification methylase|uniref:site-specific DNA-methyltransferase n=1 Tax=unclassified Cupriavidus TaxID=2640874 RepID=UPI0008EBDEB9|nr:MULTISPECIES: site-specific DNA-methyltransferase [unclassified Cupriavidus]SFB68713.1 DNA modification methylase [Cupriavidus sp. OV038]SFO58065.1 DNA modification methylase [Cupriavidus sp. OV096]